MDAASIRQILLLVWSDYEIGRGIVCGVGRFAFPARPWALHLRNPLVEETRALRSLKPAGILAQLADKRLADRLHRWKGGPVVNVSGVREDARFPTVGFDNVAVGRLAAEHFLARGFRHFAFLGQQGRDNSQRRASGFRNALADHGFGVESLLLARPVELRAMAEWDDADGVIGPWLRKLPRPLALFAHNDIQANDVLRVCGALGIAVPDEIAVLGVDCDPIVCQLAFPPLSSVALPAGQVGVRAAELMEGLLAGKAAPASPELLPPIGVVTRQSTEVLAVADPAVGAALRFIRDRSQATLDVAAVARHAGVNRRTLERSFQALLGHSPAREIVRVRIERARHLLATTGMPLEGIAEAVGFTNAVRLSEAFRRELALSPGRFRQQCGRPGTSLDRFGSRTEQSRQKSVFQSN